MRPVVDAGGSLRVHPGEDGGEADRDFGRAQVGEADRAGGAPLGGHPCLILANLVGGAAQVAVPDEAVEGDIEMAVDHDHTGWSPPWSIRLCRGRESSRSAVAVVFQRRLAAATFVVGELLAAPVARRATISLAAPTFRLVTTVVELRSTGAASNSPTRRASPPLPILVRRANGHASGGRRRHGGRRRPD